MFTGGFIAYTTVLPFYKGDLICSAEVSRAPVERVQLAG